VGRRSILLHSCLSVHQPFRGMYAAQTMSNFIPGLELSRRFYGEIVRPILAAHFPALPYAAGLIGSGSEVLGFDTEMSTDHSWGPNVHLFLRDEDESAAEAIYNILNDRLPNTFLGYAVRFVPVPDEPRSVVPAKEGDTNTHHLIRPVTLRAYIQDHFGWDVDTPLEVADWLTFPSQKLRAFTAGAVFEDTIGDVTTLRQQLAWYPQDVWLYLMAAGWVRIAQEEPLMPRAGYVGDEIGSALIGSRLVRDCMSLCFLMERQYAPYAKWFGTAFQQLACAAELSPLLWRVQQTQNWQERMAALVEVYRYLAEMHNGLGITEPLSTNPVPFHDRPFLVIDGERFAEALVGQIRNPLVQRLTERRLIGNIDQFSDSTDLREDRGYRKTLRGLFN
jgi:hypothetical protein